ncbi:MAG: hypothetical protein GY724_14965, partial [Actinomycetia bacterium]|nr:hypothetical protein [Actinomycetes bacterium]
VVQLALVEGTGQVWLAKGNHFWSFDVNGTELFDLEIRYLVSLSIDQAQGLMWVATTQQVAAYDMTLGTGMNIYLDLPLGTVVRHAEVDPASGMVWVAADSGILLFDDRGLLQSWSPSPAVERLVSLGADPGSGMAGMTGPNLYLFGSDGRSHSSLQPFGIDRDLVDLLADPGSHSVWVTDGVDLARVNRLGSIESTRP